MDALFAQLSDVACSAGRFVMFDLKKYLPVLGEVRQDTCFDATVAAYLLNPLKNDYTYEDVAREHLGLMVDEKAKSWTKSCYEAYTAYAASEKLMKKLQEEQMDKLFLEIEMPLVFTLFDMEQAGVRIEAEELKRYGEQLGEQIVQLESEIYEMAGESFEYQFSETAGSGVV